MPCSSPAWLKGDQLKAAEQLGRPMATLSALDSHTQRLNSIMPATTQQQHKLQQSNTNA
jgi:hypothetical protein